MSKQTEADFQLLQAAAKAAGIAVRKSGGMLFVDVSRPNGVVTGREWNPLADSGDALDLAVRLGLGVLPKTGAHANSTVVRQMFGVEAVETYRGYDPMAATRRAIVRAAAAISEGEQR